MQQDLEKLQNIIESSSLSNENKIFWEEKVFSLLNVEPTMAIPLLMYLDEKLEELEWLTNFMKRKFSVFKDGNKEAIESILKEEQEKLHAIK